MQVDKMNKGQFYIFISSTILNNVHYPLMITESVFWEETLINIMNMYVSGVMKAKDEDS